MKHKDTRWSRRTVLVGNTIKNIFNSAISNTATIYVLLVYLTDTYLT
jgi:hypothetical protein